MARTGNFIKTGRTFTIARRSAWLITIAVAFGGQYYPRLGLLVPVIMLVLMGMSFSQGRFWCGNFCPHGSLFDQLLLPVSRNKKIPAIFQNKYFIGAFFLFFMFNLSRRLLTAIGNAGSLPLPDRIGLVFANTYLIVLVAGGFLAVIFTPRTWCQFCPMGTIQAMIYKLGKALGVAGGREKKITVVHPQRCRACGKCARVCPMQLIPYQEFNADNQFVHEKCIKCRTCIENCPARVLTLACSDDEKKTLQQAV